VFTTRIHRGFKSIGNPPGFSALQESENKVSARNRSRIK
jgi:hypothetical protein